MIFKITHIDEHGHRHKARVTAPSVGGAMDQAEQQWGPCRGMACVRMARKPVLHLVPAPEQLERREVPHD